MPPKCSPVIAIRLPICALYGGFGVGDGFPSWHYGNYLRKRSRHRSCCQSTMMRGAGASVASAISAHGGTCSAESHHVHQRIRAILLYAGHGVRVIHVDEVHNMRGVSLAASVHFSFNPRRRGHSVVTGYRQEWITLFWFTSVTDVSDSVSVYIGFPSAAA